MTFVQILMTELFGVLVSAAMTTSLIEFLVLMVRAPKKLSDE